MDNEIKELQELKDILSALSGDVKTLQSDIRNLKTHIEYIKKEREDANKRWWNVALAGLSAVVVAVVVWITGGGLDGK